MGEISTSGVYKSRVTSFGTVGHDICGASVSNSLLCHPSLAPRILRWLPDFGKSVAPTRTLHVHQISVWLQLFDHIMHLSTGWECSRMSVHFGLFVRYWLLAFCPDQAKCVLIRVLVTKFVQNFLLSCQQCCHIPMLLSFHFLF